MITFRPDVTDSAILDAVEAWVELLAAERYQDAFEQTLHREDAGWTPPLMRTVVSNYGTVEPRPDGRVFRITSPLALIGERCRFEVERFSADSQRPSQVVGAVTYELPLNGERSDLSVLFDLILVNGVLLLSLDDLHVL